MDTIADRAFAGCTELKEIIFGKELETIGWNAFSGCTALEKVEWNGKMYIVDKNGNLVENT